MRIEREDSRECCNLLVPDSDIFKSLPPPLQYVWLHLLDCNLWSSIFFLLQRIFLLKFLCDELLNSGLIRQHLEHCAETSLELQQKLRSLSLEYKALRSREEFLARAIKTDAVIVDRVVEALKEGLASAHAINGNLTVERQSEKSNQSNILSEPQTDNGLGKEFSSTGMREDHVFDGESSPPFDTDGEPEDVDKAQGDTKQQENLSSSLTSVNNAKSVNQNEAPPSDVEPEDFKDLQGEALPEGRNIAFTRRPDNTTETQRWQDELSSAKKEISLMQSLMSSLQSQLLKLSIRRECLGSDSLGRLYWAAASPHKQLRFIVYGSLAVKIKGKAVDLSSISSGANPEGSKARPPYWYEPSDAVAAYPSLVSYQSDAEIKELIGWLRDNDPKERALKDAILHWQKYRSQDSQDCRDHALDEPLSAPPLDSNPASRATLFLESKYGSCLDSVTHDALNKHEKKGQVSGEEKIYRCKCLEPIFPARFHCLSCHKTFVTEEDLEAHREGKCVSASSGNERGKEIPDCTRGNENRHMPEKNACLELSSKFIKYQSEGSVCPYDVEEISSKFITKDSNRELVKQIGLIGSNGVPSFMPSRSPYLDDSTVMLIPKSSVSILSKDLMDVDGTFNSSDKSSVPNSRMFHSLDTRPVSERSACKTSVRAASRCHKEGMSSRDMPSCRCVVPSSSLRPLVGEACKILRRLKINLLDMEAALIEEAFRPSKAHVERRWAWRSFVKAAQTTHEVIAIYFLQCL